MGHLILYLLNDGKTLRIFPWIFLTFFQDNFFNLFVYDIYNNLIVKAITTNVFFDHIDKSQNYPNN